MTGSLLAGVSRGSGWPAGPDPKGLTSQNPEKLKDLQFAMHPSPAAIENQQLVFDKNGLRHHGPRAAGSGEPGDRRQQLEKQDGQIAHGPS